jgi:hypothetical protein
MFSFKEFLDVMDSFDLLFCKVFFSYETDIVHIRDEIIDYYSIQLSSISDIVNNDDYCSCCLLYKYACGHAVFLKERTKSIRKSRLLKYLYKGFFDRFVEEYLISNFQEF